jgi:hypothetical protein
MCCVWTRDPTCHIIRDLIVLFSKKNDKKKKRDSDPLTAHRTIEQHLKISFREERACMKWTGRCMHGLVKLAGSTGWYVRTCASVGWDPYLIFFSFPPWKKAIWFQKLRSIPVLRLERGRGDGRWIAAASWCLCVVSYWHDAPPLNVCAVRCAFP